MKRVMGVAGLLTMLACSSQSEGPDQRAEWREVLQQKKAALSPAATARDKQLYADSVAAFIRRHPNHGRAREVYQLIQLEFARELAMLGRHQDAIRFYRAVLHHDPENPRAKEGIAAAVEKLAVAQEKLERLERGMSRREVAQLLGRPIPGWTFETRRRNVTIEAWYYRTTSGQVAGVYFRDGRVFGAEPASNAKFGL